MPRYKATRYGYIAVSYDVVVEADSPEDAKSKVNDDDEMVEWDGFKWSDDVQHFDSPGTCSTCQKLRMETKIHGVENDG